MAAYWRYIAIMYARCFGVPILILGITGDVLNIFIFLTVRMYRQTPSTFYLLCAVMANFVHLTIVITSRILMVGFDYDITCSSVTWCKIRQFIAATYPPLALTLGSLATFDQFLVTSRDARTRHISNIKNARRIIIACIIFWHIHSIPFLIYNQIQSNRCIINNGILSMYWSYVHFFTVVLAIPLVTLLTFGFLAYKNMRRLTRAGHLVGSDHQLIKMICLQLIVVIMATIPYGIYNSYMLATSNKIKNAEQIEQDFLFLTVTSLSGLFNFGGSFYIFLFASSRFRRIVGEKLFVCCKRTTKIHPKITFANRLALKY